MRKRKRLLAMVLALCMVLSLAPTQAFALAYDENEKPWTETNVESDWNDRYPGVQEFQYSHVDNCKTCDPFSDPELIEEDGTRHNILTFSSSRFIAGKAFRIDFRDNGVAVINMSYADEAVPRIWIEFGLYNDTKLLREVDNKPFTQLRPDLDSSDETLNRTYNVEKGKTYYLGAKSEVKSSDTNIRLKASVRFYKAGDGTFSAKNRTVFMASPAGSVNTNYFKLTAPSTGNIKFTADKYSGAKVNSVSKLNMSLVDSNKKVIAGPQSPWDNYVEFRGVERGKTYYLKVEDDNTRDEAEAYKFTYEIVKPKYIVEFDPNGGKGLNSSGKTITSGQAIGSLPEVSKSGYKFLGWYTAKTGGTKVTSSTKVTKDMILYAQWEKLSGGTTPKKGSTVTSGAGKYKVTGTSAKNKTVTFTGAKSKNAKTVTVPATVKVGKTTYKVTSIASNAFKNNKKLTNVKIQNNVTSIGANAFTGCSKLTSVTVGKNVTSIGSKAFANCSKLTKVTLPAKTSKIGKQAFSGCKKLKTITIQSKKLTKKTVSNKAFSGVSTKTKIKVPKSKVKAYKKLFQSKGLSKKVKVTK